MLKQLLAFFLCAAFSVTTFAQVVIINSPQNIAGGLTFTNAWDNSWGVDLTTGLWTADVVAVLGDGSTADPILGCDPLANAAEVDGKIALVNRGSCEFSRKALMAQEAGAIACVIVNNAGDPVGMGGGAAAAQITIPVVMISTQAGSDIRDELAMGPVNMTIGFLKFDNDIAISNESISRPFYGVMPEAQAAAAMPTFLPAAEIINNGNNPGANPTLNAVIEYNGTEVYNETASEASVDTSIAIGLEPYTIDQGMGTYTLSYSVSTDSTDGLSNDNSISTEFFISENLYSKGSYDFATEQPRSPNIVRLSAGGAWECAAGFDLPDAQGLYIDDVTFFIWVDDGNTLGDVGATNVNVYVYEWEDANVDSLPETDELTIVGIGQTTFADETASNGYVTTQILDWEETTPGYQIPDTDKKYIVGLRYDGALNVRFGFDNNFNQTFAGNYGQFPTGLEFPHIVVTEWNAELKPVMGPTEGYYFGNLIYPVAIAMTVNEEVTTNIGEVNPAIGTFEVFPNPVSNQLNVETILANNYDQVDYTIVNSNGAIVSKVTRDIAGNRDNATLDVSTLAAGQYFLNVNTVDGSVSKAFTVQR